MTWHEPDSDIEAKFLQLREREQILDKELREIREFQTNINSLKMVPTSEIQDVIEGEETIQKKVTVYSLPNDYTGNKMTEDTRTSQKTALIKNINEFLGEDNE